MCCRFKGVHGLAALPATFFLIPRTREGDARLEADSALRTADASGRGERNWKDGTHQCLSEDRKPHFISTMSAAVTPAARTPTGWLLWSAIAP